MTTLAAAYGTNGPTEQLIPMTIKRREPGPDDVSFDILYCGICHSDIHTARNEWRGTVYPAVLGHEIVGKVTHIGANVTKVKVGDNVGVGCIVDSCRKCSRCKKGEEQYCLNGLTGTYNSVDPHIPGQRTYGGYSTHIIVDQNYVMLIPPNLDLAATAPLLCAGITTYSPLKYFNVQPGQKVGVVGLGGLGHMAVKLASAMGAHVVLFTTSPNKVDDGIRLGAKEAIISTNPENFKPHRATFDFILDTVSATHDLKPLLSCLKVEGSLGLVGVPENGYPNFNPSSIIFRRLKIFGSMIGGIAETEEVLAFCSKHNIVSDIEIIPIDKINESYTRVVNGQVKYRFVIDIAGSLKKI